MERNATGLVANCEEAARERLDHLMSKPPLDSAAQESASRSQATEAGPRATDPAVSLEKLARGALAGDEEAFETLHQRLGGGLKKFLFQRFSPNDDQIEELAQEAWIAAWQAVRDQKYDPTRAAFSTFLYAIGFKVGLRFVRQQRRALPSLGGLNDQVIESLDSCEDPADLLDLAAELDRLRSAVSHLENVGELDAEEATILAGVARGRTERDLAQDLELAPSTLHSRKKKLLNKIRLAWKFSGKDSEQAPSPGQEREEGQA